MGRTVFNVAKKESALLTMGYSSNVRILKEGTEIFSLFSTTWFSCTYSATRFTNFLSGCVSFLTLTIKF